MMRPFRWHSSKKNARGDGKDHDGAYWLAQMMR